MSLQAQALVGAAVGQSEQRRRFQEALDKWFQGWLEADFSWAGLAEKNTIAGDGTSVQLRIRQLHGMANDAELLRQGILADVPQRGIFHVSYINDEILRPLKEEEKREILVKVEIYYNNNTRELDQILLSSRDGINFPDYFNFREFHFPKIFNNCFFENNINLKDIIGDIQLEDCAVAGSILLQQAHTNDLYNFSAQNTCIGDRIKIEHSSMKRGFIIDECTIGNGIWITSSTIESIYLRDSDIGALRCLSLHSKGDFNIFNSVLSRGIEIASSKFDREFSIVSTEAQDFFLLSVCDFEDRVTISDVKWPSAHGGHVAADGSRFSDVLALDSVEPQAIRFFSGTYLDSGLNLSSLDNNAWKKAVKTEISELKKELKRGRAFQNVADIEAGCRIIRKQKEASGDTNSEQFWHNMELISRNNRSDIGISEKIFSIFYYTVSDYGSSIIRPFALLITITFVFSLIYCEIYSSIFEKSHINYQDLEQSLGYSLSRTLPIGVFDSSENEWRKILIGNGGSFRSIFVRSIATIQSISSIILIYIGVMSIRRKFKIS